MQKIINNLLLDTETSTEIYFDEALVRRWYLSPNGRYFIFFANGDMCFVSEEEVKRMLGKKDVAKYVELFGSPEEG